MAAVVADTHAAVWYLLNAKSLSFNAQRAMDEAVESVALAVLQISRETVPDMPDRIITATALDLGLRLVTRDSKILKTWVETVW